MTVGEKIKEVRELKGMSQEELAKKMGYKDRSSISKIEKDNDDNISLNTVQKAADALGCSPLYLMGWDDDSSIEVEKQRSERLDKFVELYSQLNENDQNLIDGMLKSLSSKQ